MAKFPSLTSADVIRVLKKSGYVLDRTKGSHQVFIHPDTYKRVVIPYHKKDLPKGTLHEILRQAGLNNEDILKLL